MEQVENSLKVKDLVAAAIRWQAGRCDDDDLRLLLRQTLRQRLPEYQIELLEDGELSDRILEAIADDIAKSLSSDEMPSKSFSFENVASDPYHAKPSKSELHHPVLEIELMPEPEVPPPEDKIPRFRFDPLSIFHGFDGLVRFLTWDFLSLPGVLIVACIAAVASLPFVLENPEFSKDGSPILPFLSDGHRPSQLALPTKRQELGEESEFVVAAENGNADTDRNTVESSDDSVEFTPRMASLSGPQKKRQQTAESTPSVKEPQPAEEAATGVDISNTSKDSPNDSKDPANDTEAPPAEEEEIDLDELLAPIFASAKQSSESDDPSSSPPPSDGDRDESTSAADDRTDDSATESSNEVENDSSTADSENITKTSPENSSQTPSQEHSNTEGNGPSEGQDSTTSVAISGQDSMVSSPPSSGPSSQPNLRRIEKPTSNVQSPLGKTDRTGAGKARSTSLEDALIAIEKHDIDHAIAILSKLESVASIDKFELSLLHMEAWIRKATASSRLQAWKRLNSTRRTNLLSDMLCARLLLSSSERERESMAAILTADDDSRYAAWLNSWNASKDPFARQRLQQCMLRHAETACLDMIFMANANFFRRDIDSAYHGLVTTRSRLNSVRLPNETDIQAWMADHSLYDLSEKVRRSISSLSVQLTKTASN